MGRDSLKVVKTWTRIHTTFMAEYSSPKTMEVWPPEHSSDSGSSW